MLPSLKGMSMIICSPLLTGIVALPNETAAAASLLSLLPFPGVDSNGGGGACAKAAVEVVDIAAAAATNKTKTKKMVFILYYFAPAVVVVVVGSTTILDFGKSRLRCVFASIGIVTSPNINFISF